MLLNYAIDIPEYDIQYYRDCFNSNKLVHFGKHSYIIREIWFSTVSMWRIL